MPLRPAWKHLEGVGLVQALRAGEESPSALCSSHSQQPAPLPTSAEEWKVKKSWVGDAVTAVTEAERLCRLPDEEHLSVV